MGRKTQGDIGGRVEVRGKSFKYLEAPRFLIMDPLMCGNPLIGPCNVDRELRVARSGLPKGMLTHISVV